MLRISQLAALSLFSPSHDPDSEGTSRGRDLIRSITRSSRILARVSSDPWLLNFIHLCEYISSLITLFNFNIINSICCERRRWNARARYEEAWCISRGQRNVNSSGRFQWTILENGSEGFSFHGSAQDLTHDDLPPSSFGVDDSRRSYGRFGIEGHTVRSLFFFPSRETRSPHDRRISWYRLLFIISRGKNCKCIPGGSDPKY